MIMSNYDSVLSAANELPATERLRLIDALWESIPPEEEASLSADWVAEIERRMDEIESNRAQTVPWSQVRDEALARLRHGKNH
jgi:putative addiction module component (TIGR02574 family)